MFYRHVDCLFLRIKLFRFVKLMIDPINGLITSTRQRERDQRPTLNTPLLCQQKAKQVKVAKWAVINVFPGMIKWKLGRWMQLGCSTTEIARISKGFILRSMFLVPRNRLSGSSIQKLKNAISEIARFRGACYSVCQCLSNQACCRNMAVVVGNSDIIGSNPIWWAITILNKKKLCRDMFFFPLPYIFVFVHAR